MLQSLFYLTIASHVSGITITHLQEHKTTVTTASGNRYTLIDRVRYLLLKSKVTTRPLDSHGDGPVTYPGDIKTLRIPSKGRSGPT